MVNTPENEAYTVAEVAKLLGLSRRTIVRMFEDEPGVVVLGKPTGAGRTLRIPHSCTGE